MGGYVPDPAGQFGALSQQSADVPIVAAGDVAEFDPMAFDADGIGIVRIAGFGGQLQRFADVHVLKQSRTGVVLESGHAELIQVVVNGWAGVRLGGQPHERQAEQTLQKRTPSEFHSHLRDTNASVRPRITPDLRHLES